MIGAHSLQFSGPGVPQPGNPFRGRQEKAGASAPDHKGETPCA
jgi:hypothetical protein